MLRKTWRDLYDLTIKSPVVPVPEKPFTVPLVTLTNAFEPQLAIWLTKRLNTSVMLPTGVELFILKVIVPTEMASPFE